MDNLFNTVAGLPVHPLVIHFVVVLLPLGALSLAASCVSTWWRDHLAAVSFIGLTAAVGLTVVAKESGEQLAAHVGAPPEHAQWADVLVPVAAALWVVAALWILLRWRRLRVPGIVAGVVLTALAVGVSGLVVVVGHTGAEATWANVASSSTTGPTKSAAGARSTAPSAGATTAARTPSGYSMGQVARHASASSCWTVIGASVYDLTSWINAHPGGSEPILGLCGGNGTSAFTQQHGGEARPRQELARFRIGALG